MAFSTPLLSQHALTQEHAILRVLTVEGVSVVVKVNGESVLVVVVGQTVRWVHFQHNAGLRQHEIKAFLLIVRHNTEGPPISDWQ